MRQIVLVESALLQQELNKEIKNALDVFGVSDTTISVSTKELGELKLFSLTTDPEEIGLCPVDTWYETNMQIMNLTK